MGIYRIKPQFQRALQPITNWLVRNRISPDWMTYGAVAVAALMGAGILLGAAGARPLLVLVAAGVPVRLAMNALDGQVSRALGVADPMGEVKNELSDRLADMLIFGALVFVAPRVPLSLSVGALVVTFLTPYIGILSKAVTGVRDYSGFMGKPDRMTAVAAGCVLVALTGWWGWMTAALAAVFAGGLVTIALRLRAIHGRAQAVGR
jgi:CDP-diacylglycerol--glycerol-3-phosphate 3-phosphatidyltransferase